MNRLLGRLADALVARQGANALQLCKQLEHTYVMMGSRAAQTPEPAVLIRVLDALAARCERGAASGDARPKAASPCLEARVAELLGTIGTLCTRKVATPTVVAAAAAVLAAAQAPAPAPESDLGGIAREMASLLNTCIGGAAAGGRRSGSTGGASGA